MFPQALPSGTSDVNGQMTIEIARVYMSGTYVCQTVGTPEVYNAYATLQVDPRE